MKGTPLKIPQGPPGLTKTGCMAMEMRWPESGMEFAMVFASFLDCFVPAR
jgi:hypothetical protein